MKYIIELLTVIVVYLTTTIGTTSEFLIYTLKTISNVYKDLIYIFPVVVLFIYPLIIVLIYSRQMLKRKEIPFKTQVFEIYLEETFYRLSYVIELLMFKDIGINYGVYKTYSLNKARFFIIKWFVLFLALANVTSSMNTWESIPLLSKSLIVIYILIFVISTIIDLINLYDNMVDKVCEKSPSIKVNKRKYTNKEIESIITKKTIKDSIEKRKDYQKNGELMSSEEYNTLYDLLLKRNNKEMYQELKEEKIMIEEKMWTKKEKEKKSKILLKA